jgi:glutaminyl-tRNA synthetase
VELRCSYDPATRGGDSPDGRKVKATLHWVAAATALDAEVRLYDRLFNVEQPGVAGDYRQDLNPDSLQVRTAKVEPSAASVRPGERFQFERLGYFCVDPDTRDGAVVFNRTVTLKDSWARIANR